MHTHDALPCAGQPVHALAVHASGIVRERVVTCGSSHHLRWYEPPQMNQSRHATKKDEHAMEHIDAIT
jgi:hypothetical protein